MRSSNLSLSILIIILVNKSLYLVNSSFVQTQLQYCSAIKQRTDANNARGIQRHFGVKKCPQLILRLSSSGHEMDNDTQMRFSGVGRLYANKSSVTRKNSSALPHVEVLNRLSSATVAVIGIGGVGSWVAEALCRSGVGNIVLMDLDDICVSNTNRQLHALTSTVGKMKTDEMKKRLVDINPGCNVTLIHDFISVDTANDLIASLLPEVSVVVDAIDGMYEKTALILACVNHGVPVVTCGGAAGRSDPTKIVIGDLTEVQEDRLLFKCRKELRQVHGFPKVPVPRKGSKTKVKKWRIPAVYSTEVQQLVRDSDTDEGRSSSFRRCDGALGTACFVTGTYGFVAASKVVDMISSDSVVKPRKQQTKVQSRTENASILMADSGSCIQH
ncbi:hypothetical protein ACHAXS_008786 [Conticribra weissflogii]